MIDQILDPANMALAWEQVRAKKGGTGMDGVTLARWGRNWEANIERLRQQVKTNTYKPNRPKRFLVRKKGGGFRELSRLTVSDKVLQRAVLNVLDPVYEMRFLGCSHGYRQNRSVATAVQQVIICRENGLRWALDADIEACFESLDHGILISLIRRVIKDWFVVNLMELWLKAGRKYRNQATGVPMGGVISPLWANIYLHQMDARLTCAGWRLVRYADDFLVMVEDLAAAEAAKIAVAEALTFLNLRLSERKTSIASFENGFEFLGVRFWQDSYSYTWEQKRVTVQGRKLKFLYQHLPAFYDREG